MCHYGARRVDGGRNVQLGFRKADEEGLSAVLTSAPRLTAKAEFHRSTGASLTGASCTACRRWQVLHEQACNRLSLYRLVQQHSQPASVPPAPPPPPAPNTLG